MRNNGLKNLWDDLGRDSLLVFSSQAALVGLLFLANLTIIRNTDRAVFGLLTVMITAMEVIFYFTDFGTQTTAVTLSSSWYARDRAKFTELSKMIFLVKLALGSLLMIVALILFLSRSFSQFALVLLGVFGLSLWRFMENMLLVANALKKFMLLKVVAGLSYIIVVFAVVRFFRNGLFFNLLAVFALVPFLAFSVGYTLLPDKFISRPLLSFERSTMREFISFSKWTTISNVVFILMLRMDIFMLGFLTDARTIGVYATAYTLAGVVTLVMNSLNHALMPKASKLAGPDEYRSFIKKALSLSFLIVLSLAPLFIFAEPLIIYMLKTKYDPEILAVFRLLFINFALVILLQPVSFILYADKKPGLVTLIHLVYLALMVVASVVLVPRLGVVGVAVAMLISQLVIRALSIWLVGRTINRRADVVKRRGDYEAQLESS